MSRYNQKRKGAHVRITRPAAIKTHKKKNGQAGYASGICYTGHGSVYLGKKKKKNWIAVYVRRRPRKDLLDVIRNPGSEEMTIIDSAWTVPSNLPQFVTPYRFFSSSSAFFFRVVSGWITRLASVIKTPYRS